MTCSYNYDFIIQAKANHDSYRYKLNRIKPVGSEILKMSAESRKDSVLWVKYLLSELIEGPGNELNTFLATLSIVVTYGVHCKAVSLLAQEEKTFSNITAQIVAALALNIYC